MSIGSIHALVLLPHCLNKTLCPSPYNLTSICLSFLFCVRVTVGYTIHFEVQLPFDDGRAQDRQLDLSLHLSHLRSSSCGAPGSVSLPYSFSQSY